MQIEHVHLDQQDGRKRHVQTSISLTGEGHSETMQAQATKPAQAQVTRLGEA